MKENVSNTKKVSAVYNSVVNRCINKSVFFFFFFLFVLTFLRVVFSESHEPSHGFLVFRGLT